MTYFRRFAGSVSRAPMGNEAVNNTGSTLNKAIPISIDDEGNVDLIDVSSEASSRSSFAVVRENALDGSPVEFITVGRVEDINVVFGFGNTIYVSKIGGLTDVSPVVGVGGFESGDFVIRIGIIAKNLKDPSKKDLIVSIGIEGQLE